MQNKKGFTLIELLVVLAIIGVLLTGAFIALGRAQVKSRDTKRVSDISELVKVLALYQAENSTYPIVAISTCIDGEDVVSQALLSTNVMSHSVEDPLYITDNTKCYYYESDATGLSYKLTYTLEANSTAGTQGVNIVQND